MRSRSRSISCDRRPHLVVVPIRAQLKLQKKYSDIVVAIRGAYNAFAEADEWDARVHLREAIRLSKEKIDGLAVSNAADALAIEVKHDDQKLLTSSIAREQPSLRHGPFRKEGKLNITVADNLVFYKKLLGMLPGVIEGIEFKAALILACVYDLDLERLRGNSEPKYLEIAFNRLGIREQKDKDLVFFKAVDLLENKGQYEGIELIVRLSKEEEKVNNSDGKERTGLKDDERLVKLMDKYLPRDYGEFFITCGTDGEMIDEVVATFSAFGDLYSLHDYVKVINEDIQQSDERKTEPKRNKKKIRHRGVSGVRKKFVESHPGKPERIAYGRVTTIITHDDSNGHVRPPFRDLSPLPYELNGTTVLESSTEAHDIISSYLSNPIAASQSENPERYAFECRRIIQDKLSLNEPEGNGLITACGLSRKDFIVAWCYWDARRTNETPLLTELREAINLKLESPLTRNEVLERLVKLEKVCSDETELDDFIRPASIFVTDLTHGGLTSADKLVLQAYSEVMNEHFEDYNDFILRLLKHKTLREDRIEAKELFLRLRKMSITGSDLYLLKAYKKLNQKRDSKITPVSLGMQASTYREYRPEYLEDPLAQVNSLIKDYPVLGRAIR